jgi:hypothetical protein
MKASFVFGFGLVFCMIFAVHVARAQVRYKAGYRCVTVTDSGRIYKPNSRPGERLHFRPLEIDLWYPAADGTDSAMRYGEFIGLLEPRADRFQDDTVYAGLTANLVHYLCANLGIADSSRLLQMPTSSHRNARLAGGSTPKFPLLLYLCSYNGICFENVPLFETLASHGYIVASITSVGRYPGNMSMEPGDLLEQVNDGFFAMRTLEERDYSIDTTKTGLIGYSWGGLAALVMAMNDPDIGAVLSLDGSEIHYYGDSRDEDKDFDQLRGSTQFHPVSLRAPYAYLESGGKQNDRQVDSIFDVLPALQTQKLFLRFPAAQHEDFSCLPGVAARLGRSNAKLVPFDKVSLYFFDRWLKGDSASPPDLSWTEGTESSLPVVKPPNKANLTISGRIFDNKDKSPLAYVNAGIPGKNTGTVSAPDGSFMLHLAPDQVNDSIVFSMAGYQAKSFSIAQLRSQQSNISIYLNEKVAELSTVVLTAKKLRLKKIGNTSKSTFMSVGFPLRAHGTEMGIHVDLGKTPVRLKTFNFHLADSRIDSAIFRLNIHNFQNGVPGENLLQRSILVPIGRRTGAYSIDLTDYNILLKGDVLVSLEWLGDPSASTATGVLYFSAGFFNSATWRRETSQGNWKKASGIGIGFNLDVQGK